jgi:phosphoglycerate dehydrogenase-like enzyme
MNILLTGSFAYTESQIKQIEELGEVLILRQEDEKKILKIDVSDIDAVVCNSLFLYNDISKFVNLRFIQLTSAGLDRVPLDYIHKYNIRLANACDVYSVPMAEWAVLKVLEIYKKTTQFRNSQQAKQWQKQRDLLEIAGKAVCIIGCGSVGGEVAKRFQAFDTYIIGVDLHEVKAGWINEFCLSDNINAVLNKSDIIVLTLPLTERTKHFFNKDRFAMLTGKKVLINISRGGVVDEAALIAALAEGKFLGVALDVFEQEPLPQDSLLWGFENVIVTPHNSFVSDQVSYRLFKLIIANLSELIGF